MACHPCAPPSSGFRREACGLEIPAKGDIVKMSGLVGFPGVQLMPPDLQVSGCHAILPFCLLPGCSRLPSGRESGPNRASMWPEDDSLWQRGAATAIFVCAAHNDIRQSAENGHSDRQIGSFLGLTARAPPRRTRTLPNGRPVGATRTETLSRVAKRKHSRSRPCGPCRLHGPLVLSTARSKSPDCVGVFVMCNRVRR
jgi:hypothetical protein